MSQQPSPLYQNIHEIKIGFKIIRSNQLRIDLLPLQISNNLCSIFPRLINQIKKRTILSQSNHQKKSCLWEKKNSNLEVEFRETSNQETKSILSKELLSQLSTSFSNRLSLAVAIENGLHITNVPAQLRHHHLGIRERDVEKEIARLSDEVRGSPRLGLEKPLHLRTAEIGLIRRFSGG